MGGGGGRGIGTDVMLSACPVGAAPRRAFERILSALRSHQQLRGERIENAKQMIANNVLSSLPTGDPVARVDRIPPTTNQQPVPTCIALSSRLDPPYFRLRARASVGDQWVLR